VAREMAKHFEAAGERARAVSALRSAAGFAREHGAHSDAAPLLEEALRIAEMLGEKERGAGVREIREELEEARETTGGGAGRLRIVQRKA